MSITSRQRQPTPQQSYASEVTIFTQLTYQFDNILKQSNSQNPQPQSTLINQYSLVKENLHEHCKVTSPQLKITQLLNEIDRLHAILAEQEREKHQLNQQLQNCYKGSFVIINQFILVNSQRDNIYYQELQQSKVQGDQWKQRCSELELRVRENSAITQEQMREANAKIALLTIEVERLNSLQRQKYAENENQTKYLTDLENDLKEKNLLIEKLKTDFENQKNGDYENQKNQSKQKQEESLYYKTSFEKIMIQFQQEQNKCAQLLKEKSEIEDQLHTYGNISQKLKDYEKSINQLASQIDMLTQILEEKESKIQELSKQNQQLNQNSSRQINLFAENERLTKNLKEAVEETIRLRQVNEAYTAEIERLNTIISQKNNEIQDIFLKSQSYQDQVNYLTKELDRLRKEQTKNHDIDKLNAILKSFELRIKEYEQRITILQQENQKLTIMLRNQIEQNEQLGQELMYYQENDQEVETWKKKFCELNREFHLLQEQLAMCSAELEAQKSKQVLESNIRASYQIRSSHHI